MNHKLNKKDQAKQQQSIFNELDELTWWKKEWQNMPEYSQEDLQPIKKLIISFDTYEDYFNFGKLIDQKLTSKTKSVWYPKMEKTSYKHMRYIQDDEK